MAYRNDRTWSDQFIPAIRAVVGPLLVVESSIDVDREEATDLLVFTARDLRIAARVRKASYLTRFPDEFTIRWKRDNGAQTEFAKIARGWANWLFYGFGEDGTLAAWRVIDLDEFRFALIRFGLQSKKAPYRVLSNGDGTEFAAFDVREFDASLVVAESGHSARSGR